MSPSFFSVLETSLGTSSSIGSYTGVIPWREPPGHFSGISS